MSKVNIQEKYRVACIRENINIKMVWEKSQQAIIEQIICTIITKEKHKKLENQNDISIILTVAKCLQA